MFARDIQGRIRMAGGWPDYCEGESARAGGRTVTLLIIGLMVRQQGPITDRCTSCTQISSNVP
jgi:hypothetical protein